MTVFRTSHQVWWTVTGTNAALPSVLSWTSEEPLAVEAAFGEKEVKSAFGKDEDPAVRWTLSRDMLADVISGRSQRQGKGDVHVARSANYGGEEQLLLTLTTDHTVCLRTNLTDVAFFLDSTFAFSPHGEEVMDIDTTISRILDEGLAAGG